MTEVETAFPLPEGVKPPSARIHFKRKVNERSFMDVLQDVGEAFDRVNSAQTPLVIFDAVPVYMEPPVSFSVAAANVDAIESLKDAR